MKLKYELVSQTIDNETKKVWKCFPVEDPTWSLECECLDTLRERVRDFLGIVKASKEIVKHD